MTTITFDTYAFVTKLKDAGIPEQQAAAQIETLTKAIDSALEQVRHEHDFENLVTNKDLDVKIRELELKVAKEIAESKTEMIRWLIGVGVLQTALITGLLLKITHSL